MEILAPIVAARREQPEDDLISVLVEAEITDEDGRHPPAHRCRDLLVRPAAPGRRLGHDVEADGHHAGRPASSDPSSSKPSGPTGACCGRPSRSRCVGQPTDPMFSRWVTRTSILRRPPSEGSGPAHLPRCRPTGIPSAGSVRTTIDPSRPIKPTLGLRRRPPRLPRPARRPCRDDGRHQRAAGPAPEPATRPGRRSPRRSSGSTSGGPRPSRSCSDEADRSMSEEGTKHLTSCWWERSTSGATRRRTARWGTSGTGCRPCCSPRPGGRAERPRTNAAHLRPRRQRLPGGGLDGWGPAASRIGTATCWREPSARDPGAGRHIGRDGADGRARPRSPGCGRS